MRVSAAAGCVLRLPRVTGAWGRGAVGGGVRRRAGFGSTGHSGAVVTEGAVTLRYCAERSLEDTVFFLLVDGEGRGRQVLCVCIVLVTPSHAVNRLSRSLSSELARCSTETPMLLVAKTAISLITLFVMVVLHATPPLSLHLVRDRRRSSPCLRRGSHRACVVLADAPFGPRWRCQHHLTRPHRLPPHACRVRALYYDCVHIQPGCDMAL